MGRMSGARHGKERGKERKPKARGKINEGHHKERRRHAREAERAAKRISKKAKIALARKEAQTEAQSDAPAPAAAPGDELTHVGRKRPRDAKSNAKAARKRQAMEGESIEDLVEKELSKKKLQEEKLTRESFGRRRRLKRKMQLSQLQAAIDKDLVRLKCWYPGKEAHLAARERAKNKYDPDRLRGAAKPAEEAYPWLYPDYHEAKERKEREEEEREQNKGDNYLAKYDKRWGQSRETRALLAQYLELALVNEEKSTAAAMRAARDALAKVFEMDGDGLIGTRLAWLRTACLVDMGELGEARKIVEQALAAAQADSAAPCGAPGSDPFLAMLAWDLVLIEYIGCRLLKEEEVKEEDLSRALDRAMRLCPSVAVALSVDEIFEEIVDVETVDTIVENEQQAALHEFVEAAEPRRVSLPSSWSCEHVAIVYFVRAVSWWRDAGDEMQGFLEEPAAVAAERLADASAAPASITPADKLFAAAVLAAKTRATERAGAESGDESGGEGSGGENVSEGGNASEDEEDSEAGEGEAGSGAP